MRLWRITRKTQLAATLCFSDCMRLIFTPEVCKLSASFVTAVTDVATPGNTVCVSRQAQVSRISQIDVHHPRRLVVPNRAIRVVQGQG
jgi:hypothetical protein